MTTIENILVPENREGKQTDLDYSVTLPTREEALDTFKRAYKRLLNPGVWHKLSGVASAEFQLVGKKGNEEHRLAQVNDYFKIDVPGPGPAAGDGYDWVKVELVENKANPSGEEEIVGMKLRPCQNPQGAGKDTAHFFRSDASSTWLIVRKGNTVTASYHGRNEVPNTSTERKMDNVRNALVAAGASAGLSEAQWSSLTKAFLAPEIGG
ncbi:MAG TPA: hypothetical protein VLD19_04505 [Chitinophagaceae bacterium]|nr:hypothetical protein [Chitinophagaceae bacterium]